MLKRTLLTITTILAFVIPAIAQTLSSVYTDLSDAKCKAANKPSADDGFFAVVRCGGVDGYKLHILDQDSRQSINVIAPDGVEHELDLWGKVSTGFSSVGQKAEWRVRQSGKKTEPVALIIRFNANEQPDNHNKITSYLAVAKITKGKICVTDKIPPGPNANVLARQAADASASKECLSD